MLRDGQLEKVCAIICARSGLWHRGATWSREGPSEKARAFATGELPCSSTERLMVQVAFAIWQPIAHEADLGRMVRNFDGRQLAFVASLLSALAASERDGGEAVSLWIRERHVHVGKARLDERHAARDARDRETTLGALMPGDPIPPRDPMDDPPEWRLR